MSDDEDQDPFEVQLPDGSTLGRNATLLHTEYGELEHAQPGRSRDPWNTKVTFNVVGAPHRMQITFTATEIREMWGDELHDDPAVVYGDGDPE
jgi:hypothetical protein